MEKNKNPVLIHNMEIVNNIAVYKFERLWKLEVPLE